MKNRNRFVPALLLGVLIVILFWVDCANAAEVRREYGPRGGEAGEGCGGGAVGRGPDGNVAVRPSVDGAYTDRRLAERLDVLPYSALPVTVGDQVYYQDGNTYYVPCPDDQTSYCVVAPPPQ